MSDLRVLVVEDEFIIMMELVALLEEAGAEVIGPCSSVPEALTVAAREKFDVAILDMRLGDEFVSPVARDLALREVPFVFYTGQASNDPVLAEWPDAKVIAKPATRAEIVAAIVRVVG